MVSQLYGLETTPSVRRTRHVYSVCCFLQTWRLTSMWRQSADSASTSCVNSALSVSRYRHRIYYDTGPCFRLEPRGLLLQSAHRVTAFSHRQASAHPQCSCPCYNQHQEVWKRVITDQWCSSRDQGLGLEAPRGQKHKSWFWSWQISLEHFQTLFVFVDDWKLGPTTLLFKRVSSFTRVA